MTDTTAKEKQGFLAESLDIVKTIVAALAIALVIRTLLFQPYTIPSASDQPNLYRGDYIIVTKWSYGYSRHSLIFSPPIFKGRLLFSAPQRGDIIVFKLPRDGNTDYIKRLVGLPGDRVQMKNGALFINDKPLRQQDVGGHVATDFGMPTPVRWIRETNPEGRSYLTQDHGPVDADNTDVYVVPQHCYFMMGDNRDNSLDSRFDPGLPPDDPMLGGCGWDPSKDGKLTSAGVGFVPEENLVGKAQFVLGSWDTGVDDSDHSKATLFKPWTWFTDARWNRFFHSLG